jgi:hypothetical protein
VIVVTLVHGTILLARWPTVIRFLRRLRAALVTGAPKPPWYDVNSEFANSLRAALGPGPVEVRSFPWSGGNTVWDRLSAAPALRRHIAAIAAEPQKPAQMLVGHSHGGNVCLEALRDRDTREKVTAFVSLATPYLQVRRRTDAKNVETALTILGFLLFIAVMFTTQWWLEPLVGEVWNTVVFTLALFAVTAAGGVVIGRLRGRTKAVRAWAESMSQDEQDGSAHPARLVVISDGDEALLVLKIAEALNGMLRGLWRATYAVVEFVENRLTTKRWLMQALYAAMAAAFLVLGLFVDSGSPWGPVSGVPFTILFLLKVVAIAAIAPLFVFLLVGLALFAPTMVAMLVGFPPLVFFRWLAFGWGGRPGDDITAESVPLGAVKAVRLTAPEGGRGLRHSELYNDPRVPPLIATFLDEK